MPKVAHAPTPVEQILEMCMGFAISMLENHGEFFPFAAIVNARGEVMVREIDFAESDPTPEAVLRSTSASLERDLHSGHAVLTAQVVNVNIPMQFNAPVSDGIRIELKTTVERSLTYVPYMIAHRGVSKKQREVEILRAIEADYSVAPTPLTPSCN